MFTSNSPTPSYSLLLWKSKQLRKLQVPVLPSTSYLILLPSISRTKLLIKSATLKQIVEERSMFCKLCISYHNPKKYSNILFTEMEGPRRKRRDKAKHSVGKVSMLYMLSINKEENSNRRNLRDRRFKDRPRSIISKILLYTSNSSSIVAIVCL